ncbi:hypothetical protein [Kribbella sp. VKM Ac-2571]|uniref:hypothetical protein n=1 Tax=Kribbella sp. VKM Ac-2571 TaxID=2512222 RepID=UPI001061048D|nr:hypothetical protein [Kribbella sp. VKM Ac-2571]
MGKWHAGLGRPSGEALRWALVAMVMLPLGLLITSLDRDEDRLLADAPVVSGVVVAEPVPVVDRGQPLTVSFTTQRGERVELNIEKYFEPRRTKGQSIAIQYAYDGDEVVAREAGWRPDFWSRYLYLCMGIVGALTGTTILLVSSRRRRV